MARYNRGSIESTIHAAIRASGDDHAAYVFPVHGGFTVQRQAPPFNQNHYVVRGQQIELHRWDSEAGAWTVEAWTAGVQ